MNNRKITIGRFIITLLMLVIAVIGGTYAWLSYTSKKSALVLTIGDINNSKVIIKPYEIRENMVPVNTYTSGVYSQVKAINNNDNKMLLSLFYVINQLDNVLINNGLKYTIVSSTTENGNYTLVKTGDFTTIEDAKQIIFDVKVPSNTTIYYRVYLWLDSSVGDQSLTQNSSLDIELNASVQCDANAPVLDDGMIPVVISNNGIATTISRDDDDWYNYQKQEWANMVLVTSSSRSNYLNTEGIEVSQSDILGYYVWIPRYRYKIWTTAVSNTGEEQSIDIMFESKNSPITLGTNVGSYRTHPAFWWDSNNDEVINDNEMLPGIWVGKFETTGDATTPTVLPDMQSLRNQNVSAQFTSSLKFAGGTLSNGVVTFAGNNTYGLTVATNSHLMKNSEWGAVAYLSYSIYGANREIYLNNSSSYYTGRSGGNVGGSTAINTVYTNQTSTTQYNSYGFYTWDGYLLNYNANTKTTTHDISKVASTTGNITGIYDMSGGTWEYVMGVISDSDGNPRSGQSTSGNSGFNGLLYNGTSYTSGIAFPDKKYYNLYLNSQFTGGYGTNFDFCTLSTCGGHALFETRHWFYDNGSFAVSERPWFHRGGSFQYGEEGGIFNVSVDMGAYYTDCEYSWRSVLIPVETYEVTYDANGGSGAPSSQRKIYGVTLTLSSTIPTKDGYTFLGWSTSKTATSATYDAGGSYTANTDAVLYAVWGTKTYAISYRLNGGTSGTYAPRSGNINGVVTISNPTKTVTVIGDANGTGATVGGNTSKAQTFAGWTASNLNTSTAYYGTSSSSVTTPWSNRATKVTAQYFKNLALSGNTVTLTANWTAVSFNLPTVTKTGYICTWNTASNGSGTSYESGASYTPSKTALSSVTLYAVCTSGNYNISYTLNGGTSGTYAPRSGNINGVVTISNPTKTVTVIGDANGTGATVGGNTSKAQTFAGWTASNLNTSTAYYGTSSSSVTTPWSNGTTKVTAQYFKNLALSGNTVTLTANWTAVSFNLPTVTKTGYICTWNTASNGSGTSYASGASYTPSTTALSSVTLYAVCTSGSYNISYSLNGGTSGTYAPSSGTYDSVVTISNPTMKVTVTGHANGTGATIGNATSGFQTFAGWTANNLNTSIAYYGTSSSSVTTPWSNGATKVTAQYFKNLSSGGNTVTLTANWTAASFNLPTVTKTGYTCKWNTASNGSGTSYDSGASYTPSITGSLSVTLYAVCTYNSYVISYVLNGGTSGTYAPSNGTIDRVVTISNPKKTITVTGNANRTGATVGNATSKVQTFAGWTANSLNTSTAYYGTSSSSVTTLWSNSATPVTAQYFKNLASGGSAVTLVANWTAVPFYLPTVTKTGYTCTWKTSSGTSYDSGALYTPSSTDPSSITLYAECW